MPQWRVSPDPLASLDLDPTAGGSSSAVSVEEGDDIGWPLRFDRQRPCPGN